MENIIKSYCIDCEKDTNQEIIHSHDTKDDYDYKSEKIEIHKEYKTLKCKGCDYISYATITHTLKEVDDTGQPIKFFEIHPKPEDELYDDERFLKYEHLDKLPKSIKKIYKEVTSAFEQDCRILAGIGLRILLEGICVEQNIPGKNLHLKIHNLHVKGLISSKDLPILLEVKEIGNISAHEVKSLPFKTLDHALEIINHNLRDIYIIPHLHKRMKSKPKSSKKIGD